MLGLAALRATILFAAGAMAWRALRARFITTRSDA